MPCIKKKVLNNGTVSYRIQVKAKNERTGKFEAKVMTWRKPPEFNEKQVQREVNKIAVEFEERFRKQMSGLLVADNDILFIDYANKWLERTKKTKSLNYYTRSVYSINKLYEYFGQIKLKSISPGMIQQFIDQLCETKMIQRSAKLTGDIESAIRRSRHIQKEICENSGVSRSIIFSAKSGHNIKLENARRICEALGVKYNDLFTTVTEERNYAKETISKHKRTLHAILAQAKRERLIEHNFASKDYILPIRGEKNPIECLEEDDAIELYKALQEEPNAKWKYSILIALLMGIRRGEIAGLEWKDIDFEKKTMKIQRSVQEVTGFGIFTKEPKTENSKRTIRMPELLVQHLKDYKVIWDREKEYYGDRWENTDRLFCNENGESISPGLIRAWLQKILFKAGLPIVSLHSIRHTNISLLFSLNIDPATIAARAGHSRISTTTDIYTHPIKNNDVIASEAIDKLFK